MKNFFRIAATLALAAQAIVASAATAPTQVTLVPGQISQNYVVAVDGSTQSLTITLTGSGGDLDLFVRYGTPFPEQSTAVSYATVDPNTINHYAHYHALSGASSETITILPSSRFPLKAGNWYVVVANDDSSTSPTTGTGTLSATLSTAPPVGSITFDFNNPSTDASDPTNDCDDSFWNDATAVSPVGGNPGTTLGQQRRNALNYAGQQLVQQLNIQVALQIDACGAHLGGDKNSAVIAHAGPTTFFFDDPEFPANYFPKKFTWYPSTLAVKLGGTSLCALAGGSCSGTRNEVIQAVFNEDIGGADVINGEPFYYGYTPDSGGAPSIDFVSVAMHEMTHGLGFIGLVNTDPTAGPLGAKGGIDGSGVIAYDNLTEGPWDDIYDDYVAIVSGATYTPFLGYEVTGAHDADRAAAMESGPTVRSSGQYNPGTQTGLRWFDAVAASSSVNINKGKAAPDDFPSLYAPCDETKTTTCTTQPSSTLSHTVQAGDMMNAFYSNVNLRSMGLAVPMLAPLGWSTALSTAPTFATPVTGNWYDQTHSGHGFDLQFFGHDPVNGDVYALTLYTYNSSGKPEWFQATGYLVDGMFLPTLDPNGNSLTQITYQTTANAITGFTINNVPGSVMVDFNQAGQSPACRNLDRTGAAQLAVMYWKIEGDQASWCVQPIVPSNAHGSPDYNGMWYDAQDSGWGFELLDETASGGDSITVVMYLPGATNNPNWLIGSGTLNGNTVTIPLSQTTNGYCRTCTPPASLQVQNLGTMTMTFTSQTTGTATIAVSYPGGGGFNRSNVPISMLSAPTAH
jgi:hypothetical protein